MGTPTTSAPSLQRSSGSNKSFQKKPPGTCISLIRDHGEILKEGERSLSRRCERKVRGGGPFIGEGGSPRVHGRRPWRVPPPLPHSCGGSSTHIKISPLTIPLICINFPPKLMQALI